jgi:hypothetical protein
MDFYVLKELVGHQAKCETDYFPVDPVYADPPRCSQCNEYIDRRIWQMPYLVELRYWKAQHGELIYSLSDPVVSVRFVENFLREGLTGLTFLGDAEVVKVVPKRMTAGMPKYIVARQLRSKTELDLTASGVKYEKAPTCPQCRLGNNLIKLDRVALIESTWDGSDIFIARGLPGVTILSQRFRDFCRDFNIRNAYMIPASEYSLDYSWVGFDKDE